MSDAADRKPSTPSEPHPTHPAHPARASGSAGEASTSRPASTGERSSRERSAPSEGSTSQARAEATQATGTTETKGQDVVILGPPTSDGQGVHVLRARNERLEAGELRALRDGQPVTGEVVSLAPRKDMPRVCDVKESWSAEGHAPSGPPSAPTHKGPAQVATAAYRDGWDQIFGARPRTPLAKDLN